MPHARQKQMLQVGFQNWNSRTLIDINQNDLKPEVVKKQDAMYYRDKLLARVQSL